jgi:hypothetical protein
MRGQGPDAKRPAVAGTVISSQLARHQSGISPNRSEVRLRPLNCLLRLCGGINGEEAAATGLKEPDEGQSGDRERDDNLEQSEPIAARNPINAHRRRLPFQ